MASIRDDWVGWVRMGDGGGGVGCVEVQCHWSWKDKLAWCILCASLGQFSNLDPEGLT